MYLQSDIELATAGKRDHLLKLYRITIKRTRHEIIDTGYSFIVINRLSKVKGTKPYNRNYEHNITHDKMVHGTGIIK